MGELTVFADYRLPQLFRSDGVGVLRLDAQLAASIEERAPIPQGSVEEVGLRAATVWAAAQLGDALRSRPGFESTTQAQLDYYLWKLAVTRDAAGALPQFHRTRCCAY